MILVKINNFFLKRNHVCEGLVNENVTPNMRQVNGPGPYQFFFFYTFVCMKISAEQFWDHSQFFT